MKQNSVLATGMAVSMETFQNYWPTGEVDVFNKNSIDHYRNPYATPKFYRPKHDHDQRWLKWWLGMYQLPVDCFDWFERQMAGKGHMEFDRAIERWHSRAVEAPREAGPVSSVASTSGLRASLQASLKPARQRQPYVPSDSRNTRGGQSSQSEQLHPVSGAPLSTKCDFASGKDERRDSLPKTSIPMAGSGNVLEPNTWKRADPISGPAAAADGIPPPMDGDFWAG